MAAATGGGTEAGAAAGAVDAAAAVSVDFDCETALLAIQAISS